MNCVAPWNTALGALQRDGQAGEKLEEVEPAIRKWAIKAHAVIWKRGWQLKPSIVSGKHWLQTEKAQWHQNRGGGERAQLTQQQGDRAGGEGQALGEGHPDPQTSEL